MLSTRTHRTQNSSKKISEEFYTRKDVLVPAEFNERKETWDFGKDDRQRKLSEYLRSQAIELDRKQGNFGTISERYLFPLGNGLGTVTLERTVDTPSNNLAGSQVHVEFEYFAEDSKRESFIPKGLQELLLELGFEKKLEFIK